MKVSGQLHAVAALPPGNIPDAHRIAGWVGLRAGLDVLETRKNLTSGGNRTPDTPAHNIVTISRQYVMAVSEILLSEFQNKKSTLPALMSSVYQIQAKYASPMGKNAAVTRRANYALRQTLQQFIV